MAVRVLLVEDERLLADAIRVRLLQRGYIVAWTGDGSDALELVEQFGPHVIVTDIGLPGMTGLDLARNVASTPATASVPIIVISAQTWQVTPEVHRQCNIAAVLLKPFETADLFQAIEAAVVRRDSA